jgi:hypothetical protein
MTCPADCPIDLRALAAGHGYRHGWDGSRATAVVPAAKAGLEGVILPRPAWTAREK